MQKYVVVEKAVGQTPLQAAENWRLLQSPQYDDTPLAYAGRLDPMASGKLLLLIGEECKKQSDYHRLDKEYEFEVLFDVSSDTGDVLGLVAENEVIRPKTSSELNKLGLKLKQISKRLTGEVTFPYPKFSSKTVAGKPLHTWTLEGRLHEIAIPTYTSKIYNLKLIEVRSLTGKTIYEEIREKIERIPPVTDVRKAIGNDFRRPAIRVAWEKWHTDNKNNIFFLAKFKCICASGTYMRTLAEEIAKETGGQGLAYSIHRTKIGQYHPVLFNLGFWLQQF